MTKTCPNVSFRFDGEAVYSHEEMYQLNEASKADKCFVKNNKMMCELYLRRAIITLIASLAVIGHTQSAK
jgi:hypothetical protein